MEFLLLAFLEVGDGKHAGHLRLSTVDKTGSHSDYRYLAVGVMEMSTFAHGRHGMRHCIRAANQDQLRKSM